ncbi:hypothetical protein K440DRAFT_54169 [Wilcoxina mikolae CBS 423.85]|nr:hypothetical protein K440DRAFT_54169 [Wilcoxina mikolae CBS 423.85]
MPRLAAFREVLRNPAAYTDSRSVPGFPIEREDGTPHMPNCYLHDLALRSVWLTRPARFIPSQIPLSDLKAVEARHVTAGITVSWQAYDATDDATVVELAEVLLRLVPKLVMKAVDAAGGEDGAKELMRREEEWLDREWWERWEEALREEEKRCIQRKKKRKRAKRKMGGEKGSKLVKLEIC